MDEYQNLYIIFGTLFLGGSLGFWIVTRPLRDPSAVYESHPVETASSAAAPKATQESAVP